MRTKSRYPLNWRDYQRRFQRDIRRKRFMGKLPSLVFCSGGFFLILALVFCAVSWVSGYRSQAIYASSNTDKQSDPFAENLSRQDVSNLLRDLNLNSAYSTDLFVLEKGETRYTIKSSLDPALQNYILRLLKRSRTLQAAVVVLNRNDGRILAMASYEKSGNGENLCLKADFPAASLFKIVSAAAALESAGFSPNRDVFYDGSKHTLYKRQLKNKIGRYTSKTSFRKAFASSINSVFGKLGIYDLGQRVMADYADKFLFNHEIPFDLPVAMSIIHIPDDDFGLAEIASGFNKKTMISPLHAALLASVVANNGVMVAPWLVEHICNGYGESLYERQPTMLASPVSKGTAENLKVLMRDTVLYGTCRKPFRLLRRKKAFKDVELGGKTGTINDKIDRFKYDWLAAYAIPRNNDKAICIAVLSVHGEKLGVRANELGRHIINYYLNFAPGIVTRR